MILQNIISLKRDESVDFLKEVVIFCVVLGHLNLVTRLSENIAK